MHLRNGVAEVEEGIVNRDGHEVPETIVLMVWEGNQSNSLYTTVKFWVFLLLR